MITTSITTFLWHGRGVGVRAFFEGSSNGSRVTAEKILYSASEMPFIMDRSETNVNRL
jgi:hypothetical protein